MRAPVPGVSSRGFRPGGNQAFLISNYSIIYAVIKEFKMKSAQKISFNVNPYIVNGIIHQIAQLAQHAYLNFGDVTMVRIAPMVAMK